MFHKWKRSSDQLRIYTAIDCLLRNSALCFYLRNYSNVIITWMVSGRENMRPYGNIHEIWRRTATDRNSNVTNIQRAEHAHSFPNRSDRFFPKNSHRTSRTDMLASVLCTVDRMNILVLLTESGCCLQRNSGTSSHENAMNWGKENIRLFDYLFWLLIVLIYIPIYWMIMMTSIVTTE